MPNIEQLRSLAERIRMATGPDMGLDGELYHLHPTLAGVRGYTSSIDAALALVERLLPGWKWQVGHAFHHDDVVGWLAPPQASDWPSSLCYVERSTTPALAILRALVAALIDQGEAGNGR